MKTLEEIRHTPYGLLSDEEIGMLSSDERAWAHQWKANQARYAACPGHERVGTASREQSNRGYHVGECKHCGKDMSYDSGD